MRFENFILSCEELQGLIFRSVPVKVYGGQPVETKMFKEGFGYLWF